MFFWRCPHLVCRENEQTRSEITPPVYISVSKTRYFRFYRRRLARGVHPPAYISRMRARIPVIYYTSRTRTYIIIRIRVRVYTYMRVQRV